MAKIIEAKAIISGEDRLSKVIDGISKKFKGIGKDIKAGANLDNLNRQLASTKKQLEAIDRINSAQGKLAGSKYGLAGLKAEADRVAAALAAAKKAGDMGLAKELTTQSKAAQRAVDQAAGAISRQSAAVRDARRALNEMGVPVSDLVGHERRLRTSVDQTTAAIARQTAAEKKRQEVIERAAAKTQSRRDATTGATATLGVLANQKGKQIGLDAINSAAEFDLEVRKQRVFTDINDTEQSGLLAQAKRIGQEMQFSNRDVVKAQTASMQGLPAGFSPALKAAVAEGIVQNVRNYATLMETDLKEGAETIRAYLQATGKNISTKEKALFEANKATNQLVKMAKLGGMNGEDVAQFMKYAASSNTTAGMTTESLMSLGALARRGGLRGDEAGVFMRATANKLVSPTKKGLAAYNAAGIKHSDFVKMPERLSTGNLEGQFQLSMGKSFTPAIRKRLDAINSNKDLIGDQGRYTEAVVKAVGDILGKTKKGTVRASDSKVAAKAVGDYYKVAAQSVDVEGLLDRLMSANPTLAQLNAILTDKHGGKGAITQRQWDEFKASREQIKTAADDPDWAKKKADEVFAGLGGAVENLKGSWENLVLNIGNANEGLIRFTADGIGKGLDAFSNLSSTSQQVLSLIGGAGAAGGGIYGAMKFINAVFGNGGSAAALTGSAALLDGAAGALTTAAIKLGGGTVVDTATKTAATTTGSTLAGGLLAGLPSLAILGSGAALGAYLGDAMPKAMGGDDLGDRYLDMRKRIAAVEARMVGSIGYGNTSRALRMPGGAGGSTGFPTTMESSRGLVTDYLLGKQQTRVNLPSFGAGDKQMPAGASGPVTAEVKSPVPVSVSGEGTVTVNGEQTVHVVFNTAMFEAAVAKIVNSAVSKMSFAANGPGSTGKSSPDAGKGGRG